MCSYFYGLLFDFGAIQEDHRLAAGVVNCCKHSVMPGVCCSQTLFIVLISARIVGIFYIAVLCEINSATISLQNFTVHSLAPPRPVRRQSRPGN